MDVRLDSPMLRTRALVLLAVGLQALGALYEAPAEAVLSREYDVIVVGGAVLDLVVHLGCPY